MHPDLPQTEVAIVALTNAFRKEHALAQVKPNAKLAAAARAYAAHLASSGAFRHDADGQQPHQRAQAQGYRFCFVAENLAMDANRNGFTTAQLAEAAMAGWRKSPVHRDNLLRAGAMDIGIGIARVPEHPGKYITVQVLARPEGAGIEFKIENKAGFPVQYMLGSKPHTLAERITVTHRGCNPLVLSFPGATPPIRYEPARGERVVVKALAGQKITIERK